MKQQGGLPAIYAANLRKAKKLYSIIDNHTGFTSTAFNDCRSLMNVIFSLE